MTEEKSAFESLVKGLRGADVYKLNSREQQFFDQAARADVLNQLQDRFAENGGLCICIGGKIYEFVAEQPGVLKTYESEPYASVWFDHASLGISVEDVKQVL